MKQIIATLGPSSSDPSTIKAMVDAGVTVLRLNLSHTIPSQIYPWMRTIRSVTDIPVWVDTQGPQIRTGPSGGSKTFHINQSINIGCDGIGDADLEFTPRGLYPFIKLDDIMELDFHGAEIRIIATFPTYSMVTAICTKPGIVGANKAVTTDNESIRLPILSDCDRIVLRSANDHGISGVALSFVRDGFDVGKAEYHILDRFDIISKIETKEAVDNVADIAGLSSALLIDRGDLSRSMPMEQVPYIQKMVIKHCNQIDLPVYVATNLLESMVVNNQPTRAEVNDIINTLMDGADGLVLAAETAIGKYPVECVQMVSRLIRTYENA